MAGAGLRRRRASESPTTEAVADPSPEDNAWREVLSDGRDLPELSEFSELARAEEEEDSWVDAVVTLLAVVIFGLGWALFELDGAESRVSDYDRKTSTLRMASVDAPIAAAQDAGYGEPAWRDRSPEWPRRNSSR